MSPKPGFEDREDDAVLDAFTVAQFCVRHGISKAFFFKLQGLGIGPRTMLVGRRRLVSREAAQAWRLAREQAALTGDHRVDGDVQ